MRVTEQLALVVALIAASSEANPLTQRSNPDTFSLRQVGRPATRIEYRGRSAVNRVLRKFNKDSLPSLPSSPKGGAQKPLTKVKGKKGKQKDAAPAGAGETTANSEDADQEYVCEVTIGGQKTNLNFDTGSSDLYVPLSARFCEGSDDFAPEAY